MRAWLSESFIQLGELMNSNELRQYDVRLISCCNWPDFSAYFFSVAIADRGGSSSFSHSPQLVVKGEVESLSKDIVTDPGINPMAPAAAYYLARILVTPEGMKALGKRQMQPGMPVQVVIKTGERSLLTYLIDPLVKRITVSMKEE